MTAYSNVATLRFEEANISLGDELRGARASTGKSIVEIERELRIKAKYIIAIEDGDFGALPGKVYTDGFLRSYARYLSLDPDDLVNRFHREHGIVAPGEAKPVAEPRKRAPDTFVDPLAAIIAKEPPRPAYGAAIGRVMVMLWPVALFAAVAGGGWYAYKTAVNVGVIPQDFAAVQRSAVEAELATLDIEPVMVGASGASGAARPDGLAYADADAVPYWRADPPAIEPAEGPVSAIDTETSGVFGVRSGRDVAWATPWGVESPDVNAVDDARSIAAEAKAALTADFFKVVESPAGTEATAAIETTAPSRFALRTNADVWVRVTDASGVTLFTGVLAPGTVYDIPADKGVTLHTGNAGGLYIDVGSESFGPLGEDGVVMRGIALDRDTIRDRFSSARTAENHALR